MKLRLLFAIAAGILLALSQNSAEAASDCETRLHAIGRSSTDLRDGEVIQMEGQSLVYHGGPAQGVCSEIDRKNAPVAKLTTENKQLTDEKTLLIIERDALRGKLAATNYFKRNYVAGWLGWVMFWSLVMFLIGRSTKPSQGQGRFIGK